MVKLNANGTGLVYATFLGGTADDHANGLAIDSDGNAYVTGNTASVTFTPGAFSTSYNGGASDGFVVKLNAAGTGLTYGTFLGGTGDDGGHDLAVDGAGNAYVTGYTYSTDFPATPGAFNTDHNGTINTFVLKLNAGGTGLNYGTFLGNESRGQAITVDGLGAAYVLGSTTSADFPTTAGAFDRGYNGAADAFVVKLNAGGTGLEYGTFLGGTDAEYAEAIAVSSSGKIYATGITYAADFPTTPDAFDRIRDGATDSFVVKLNPAETGMDYITLLGGTAGDFAHGLAVDGEGNAYILGNTTSSDFPTTPGAYDTSHNGGDDVFVVKLGLGEPLSLTVTDLDGQPVTAMSLNDDGWPTPNPLTVTVTINNLSDTIWNNTLLDFKMLQGPPYQPIPRFEVLNGGGEFVGAVPRYQETVNLGTLYPGQRLITNTLVWVQPSVTTTLNISASLFGNFTSLGQAEAQVDIPQAHIHPLVFVPGFLGTWPPEHGGRLDPLTQIYDNLLLALQQSGYEPGGAGSGSTLIPFGYDWRDQLSYTGQITLRDDIEAVRSTAPANKKAYVDYDTVDIVAHSAGGLVARAYVEHRYAANEQSVNKLITMATPHQGTPGAYRGWYGADTNPLRLNESMFQGLMDGLAYCSLWPNNWPLNNFNALWEDVDSFEYIRDNMPSVPQLLPPANAPAYLLRLDPPYDAWPFKDHLPPPNLFLDDLNNDLSNVTGQLDYDVTKLRQVPQIISSFSPMAQTDGRYRVITTTTPPLWEYGEPVLDFTEKITGDVLVPAYSGDLTGVITASTIFARDESNPNPEDNLLDHVSIVYEPVMVRRVISYVTGIDVTNSVEFWKTEYNQPSQEEVPIRAFFSCTPGLNLLITDPLGRRAGFNLTTGERINEISGAFVPEVGEEPQIILLPKLEGDYLVQGLGAIPGDYAVGAMEVVTPGQTVVLGSVSGPVTVGEMYTLTLEIPPIYFPIIFKNATNPPTLLSQPEMSAPIPVDKPDSQLPQFISPVAAPTN